MEPLSKRLQLRRPRLLEEPEPIAVKRPRQRRPPAIRADPVVYIIIVKQGNDDIPREQQQQQEQQEQQQQQQPEDRTSSAPLKHQSTIGGTTINDSTRSTRRAKQPKIPYLIYLIEELKKEGEIALADELRIIQAENDAAEERARLNPQQTYEIRRESGNQLKTYHPEIYKYVRELGFIGLTLKVSLKNTPVDAPDLKRFLSTEATDRIFNRLLDEWKRRPKVTGLDRKSAKGKFNSLFNERYPGGDKDYFFETGKPYREDIKEEENKEDL